MELQCLVTCMRVVVKSSYWLHGLVASMRQYCYLAVACNVDGSDADERSDADVKSLNLQQSFLQSK